MSSTEEGVRTKPRNLRYLCIALPSFNLEKLLNRKFDSKAKWVEYDVVSDPVTKPIFMQVRLLK